MFAPMETDSRAAEDDAVAWLDLTQSTVGASQREQLRAIAHVHSLEIWADWGWNICP